jgi:hypothetical protein
MTSRRRQADVDTPTPPGGRPCECHPQGLDVALQREFVLASMGPAGNCMAPGCLRRVKAGDPFEHFCSRECHGRDRATRDGVLLGSQVPTFLWVPQYDTTAGLEVIEMAKSAGLVLDPWQQLLVMHAFAEDPFGAWLCFEIAIIVSRQNGKGSILEAVELAWLFLFGERLIIHSAHLFETSREHFLRISTLIQMNPDFDRRVKRMREGRGAEEIELLSGARLKFMTRKGGAGRGFTGDKTVMDEAMYLDAGMMAAGLPTMATRPNAQIWYTGSAGMRHSTQLGAVRRRAYTGSDPSLMYAEWTAETRTKAIEVDGHGVEREIIVIPDPRGDPVTHAKVNPGYGPVGVGRITGTYIAKEMRALGGAESVEFGTERLGIGDWPEEDDAWAVITKQQWSDVEDRTSEIGPGRRYAFGLDADASRNMCTITSYGLRADGRGHLETVTRRKGYAWVLPWFLDEEHPGRRAAIGIGLLSNGAAAQLFTPLVNAKLTVHCPSGPEYAQACGDLYTSITERLDVRHLGQPSQSTAVGAARQLKVSRDGAWVWDRTVTTDQSTLVGDTLAKWVYDHHAATGGGWMASHGDLVGDAAGHVPPVNGRGASGFAAARSAGRVGR